MHIPNTIIALGPVWAYWAFPMERYCGLIRPAIKSRKNADASLERYIIECAQLAQISLIYNLHDEIHALHPRPPVMLPRHSLSNIDGCKIWYLL